MCMLWNFSALEYSRCLAIPLGLLSLSTLNSFLSVPKPSAPWTSMAVSFQHPLSCLSQRPSPRLKGPLTAHIPPSPALSLAAAQPWSLLYHSHSCGVLIAHLPEPSLPMTAVVWILFGLLPWFFDLQVQPETPNPMADLLFFSYLYLAHQAWRSRLKKKRIHLRSDGCLWKGNGLV